MPFVFLQRNSCSQNKDEQSEFAKCCTIFSGEEEIYHYTVKFIAIFSMYDTKQIPDSQLSMSVNKITIRKI